MDFLSSTILSGMLYDGFKYGASITAEFLKNRLQGWVFDDTVLERLSNNINQLELEDLAEHVIEKKLNESQDVIECLRHIKVNQSVGSVVQSHYGSGDNVVNKTIYKK